MEGSLLKRLLLFVAFCTSSIIFFVIINVKNACDIFDSILPGFFTSLISFSEFLSVFHRVEGLSKTVSLPPG